MGVVRVVRDVWLLWGGYGDPQVQEYVCLSIRKLIRLSKRSRFDSGQSKVMSIHAAIDLGQVPQSDDILTRNLTSFALDADSVNVGITISQGGLLCVRCS